MNSAHKFSMRIMAVFFFIIIHATSSFAVSESAVLFLLISPSPQANAMGNTYGNLVCTDPIASLFNPAYLGFYAQKHNFGFSYSEADWLPVIVSDMNISCASFNFGYTLKNAPVSFGLGYHHLYLDLGEQIQFGEGPDPIGTFNSYDKAEIISASLLLDYFLRIGVGANLKWIKSTLMPDPMMEDYGEDSGKATAHDIGIAVQVPCFDIISDITHKSSSITKHVMPFWQWGFSYCIVNIGDEIYYIDPDYSDPLPRNSSIGYNSQLGFKYKGEISSFNIVSAKYAYEAEGFLVERTFDDYGSINTQYLSGFFDTDPDIRIYKSGWEFDILNMLYIRKGHYDDENGSVVYDTSGWGINFMQPLRLFLLFGDERIENALIKKLLNNLDIEYHNCRYETDFGHPLSGTTFDGIIVNLKTVF